MFNFKMCSVVQIIFGYSILCTFLCFRDKLTVFEIHSTLHLLITIQNNILRQNPCNQRYRRSQSEENNKLFRCIKQYINKDNYATSQHSYKQIFGVMELQSN